MTETEQRKTHFDTTTRADVDIHLAVDIDELRTEVREKYRAGASGEANARTYEVFGYSFIARKP